MAQSEKTRSGAAGAAETRQRLRVREIVKMDIAYHGAGFIIGEFACATLFSITVTAVEGGAFVRERAMPQLIGAVFFLSCALNALTFLLLTIETRRRNDAPSRSLARLQYTKGRIAWYTLAACALLLLPLLFPVLALWQWRDDALHPASVSAVADAAVARKRAGGR